MSIYNSSKPKASSKTSDQTKSANTSKIRNDKDLTSKVKEFDKKIGATKEIIYDHKGEMVGLLLRSGEPYLFSVAEANKFTKFMES